MDPLTKEHNIKYFRIEALFGDRNIHLNFDQKFRVLIGENGIGKTSVLNALYYTLTGRFNKLRTLEFKSISVEFNSGKNITIEKDDLVFSNEEDLHRNRQELLVSDYIQKNLTEREHEFISFNLESGKKISHSDFNEIVSRLGSQLHYPSSFIRRHLQYMFSGKSGKLDEARRVIAKELDADILYFPTYRRIEEELHKLGSVNDINIPQDDKRLIQFGMDDVSNTFTEVLEVIKNSAILGFSEITGEMLSQYLEGPPQLDSDIKERLDPKLLKIILERVGPNITDENKTRILDLIKSGEVFQSDNYRYLLNFLSKLVKAYDQQKDLDNAIKAFESTCNSYLTGKKVIYNESKVTIDIVNQNSDQSIELRNLSSGEKQIISMFSKIIFNKAENLIVLFDEPELSLSLEWQRKLLPDILKSKKCKLLLSVTHSPFIFDNDLDSFAEEMNKYVSYINPTQENNS
ncbi:AAA family ATPase [Puia dinghuensis]|uniref:ATP-binding protein n=1 Tax=Puia dinghuensis TaxID=1792502 RepID=A0A8J2UCF2_9BACT|nr:AAA family ATPase [Puia dinghuensis]GGA96361.1 ATP-binding protein [Puia dinghuensis]